MNDKTPQPLYKAVFLDRDGVLNQERGDYTWQVSDFEVCPGVPEALEMLKQNGYYLIIVTNQAGIAKGLYSKTDVVACHQKLQETCGYLIDQLYMAPSHPSKSESLSRKPDSLMLEKGMARFNLDPAQCWLVGDRIRDIQAAEKVNVKAILVGAEHPVGTYSLQQLDLLAAAQFIVNRA